VKYAARHLHHLNGIHIKNIVASNVVNRPIYKIGASHSFVKNVTKNSKFNLVKPPFANIVLGNVLVIFPTL